MKHKGTKFLNVSFHFPEQVSSAVASTTSGVATNGLKTVQAGVSGTGTIVKRVGAGVVNSVSDLGSGLVQTGSNIGMSNYGYHFPKKVI